VKAFSSARGHVIRVFGIMFVASLLSGLVPSYAVSGPAEEPKTAPTPPPATVQSSEAQLREQWQKAIAKVPMPKKGCFTASYPKQEWQEVPCGTPSPYPNPPGHDGPRPNTTGSGSGDISTQVSGLISSAAGSFDSVTPATITETGAWRGSATADAFTLQLNTQFFPTTVCGGGVGCQGWQQFIYSQNQCSGPCVFMEYWLLNFGPRCPAGPWQQAGNNCWFNSANQRAPAVTAAQLQGTTLTGTVAGGTDTVVLTTANGNATATAADSVLNLEQSWNTVEWNIFGDCCSSQANFSAGSTIILRLTVTHGDTDPLSHGPYGNSFTGETNNLTVVCRPSSAKSKTDTTFTASAGAIGVHCDLNMVPLYSILLQP
jgi:hypothetical protein